MGFEHKLPYHCMLAMKLDLSSTFNHVTHLKLLSGFIQLHIHSWFLQFYKSFLNDHWFHIQGQNTTSKWVQEQNGSPQGTVSSPILFLLYLQLMLNKILPDFKLLHIEISLFTDDITIWTTGPEITKLETKITTAISFIYNWTQE